MKFTYTPKAWTVMVESDSKATVQETKKRKRPTVYSSDDSEEEKSDTEE